MLTALGGATRRWMGDVNPWTNVYGLARTLLATGTALTLAFNPTTLMFRPAAGGIEAPICQGMSNAALFCLVPRGGLEWARWLAVALLVVVASGWRPRLTAPVHWWLSFSLHSTALATDGGDQVTSVLTLLLLPLTLTDGRRWHWDPPRERGEGARLVALSSLTAIRLQVALVYFHAAVAKFPVREWADGTALYYWLLDPGIGASPWLAALLRPLLTQGVPVALLTWSVLVLEVFLAAGLVVEKRHRGRLLLLGLGLHGGIALIHGLPSFALAMAGALVLFLRPLEDGFAWLRLRRSPSPRAACSHHEARLCSRPENVS
ncbi:sporulation-delaying protein SdpB family protein [Pyxidicoccus fallax]|uniref:sporulation-delaying protein SdpB family protein n=1 Tax=Pyxidicoccus fallax TaxID=394095 RepID=UPI001FE935CD|nr:sporulation-delaying protein SdpB family protein [Pyxidicoccus fallax]